MSTGIDVHERLQIGALATIGHAALGAVDRAAFLPIAAREAARQFGSDACEVWLDDEDGLALAAVFRRHESAPGRSLDQARLADSLVGPVRASGWLAVPIPGDPKPRGTLALLTAGSWTDDDVGAVEAVATVVGLGLAAISAGDFDEQSRDQFLALLGHDLRSPLSNVRVGAQLARRNLEAGDLDSVREALSIIESQSARLVARLEALLDAVAATGRRLIKLESLDVGAMAEEAVAPYRLAARETGSGTRFRVQVESGTPFARGDAEQIRQVLDHVLDNAAKYASGGDVTVTVRAEGNSVRVDVCDTGPGIRPEDLERVFMPFGRGRTEVGRDGYGLGLYLARSILAAHGGRVWIARTSRSGTCMAFTLPAADSSDV
jgi:signal transduction histidine kinase